MKFKSARLGLVWGGVLILVGLLLLVNQFVELSPWVWVLLLAVAGLGAFALYLADRSDWAMLLATYVLWAIAILIALVTLDILRDEAVAAYCLVAITLPFLATFLRDRTLWWALIPAYVLLAIGLMMVLIGLGLLSDALVPAFVLLAIAIPFFVVYLRDRSLWWALIPGGILAVIGLSFLAAESAFEYIGAVVLVVVGVWLLVRAFTRKEPAGEAGLSDLEAPATTGPEIDEPPTQ
jgi:hypothetical protein